jgi:hypothetical protein
MLPSPRDVAERSEAFRLCHVSRITRILSSQSTFASLDLALLARALRRADVALCGHDKRAARASFGASVDSIREAQFSLDDEVHEVVWDVVIVGWRRIHRTRRLACNGDDDRIAPYASAPESDVHPGHFDAPMPSHKCATPASPSLTNARTTEAAARL